MWKNIFHIRCKVIVIDRPSQYMVSLIFGLIMKFFITFLY